MAQQSQKRRSTIGHESTLRRKSRSKSRSNSRPQLAQLRLDTPEDADGVATLLAPRPQNISNIFDLISVLVSNAKLERNLGPDFVGYLAGSGIKTAWVRAIVALYEEPRKPDDPLVYILRLMGAGIPDSKFVIEMQDKVKELRLRVLELQGDKEELNQAILDAEEALQKKSVSFSEDNRVISPYISDDDLEPEGQIC